MDAFMLGHKPIRFYFLFVLFLCVWKSINQSILSVIFLISPLWAQCHRIWSNSSLSILRTYKWPSFVSQASPAASGKCVKTAPSWQGRRLRWWLMSSGCSSGILPTNLLQSESVLNKKYSEKQKKRRMRWADYIPSTSILSTSSYLCMNICLLFSVWAPIGLDRSRKVAGFDRLRVCQGQR